MTQQHKRRAGKARIAAVVGVLAVSVFFAACDRPGGGADATGGAALDSLSIFYTCDTSGHIEPCRCASGMAGGISRRRAYMLENAPGEYLLVDAGNVAAGPREWEVLELEYILRGYDTID